MASTSTNKQPLLIDRPFLTAKDLKGAYIDFNVTVDIPNGSKGVLVLDCTKNDGGMVEDIYSVSRDNVPQSYETVADFTAGTNLKQLPYSIVLYLCPSNTALDADSAYCIGTWESSKTSGDQSHFWGMPYSTSPVARLGSTNQGATGADAFTGVTPTMYRQLYIPKGQCLWAVVNKLLLPNAGGQPVSDTAAQAPIIFAQGGFY